MSNQHPVDFILEPHALLAKIFHMEVVKRLDIGFGAMNLPVDFVIGIEKPDKMTVRFFEMPHQRHEFRKFFCQFMRCVGHDLSPNNGCKIRLNAPQHTSLIPINLMGRAVSQAEHHPDHRLQSAPDGAGILRIEMNAIERRGPGH